MAILLTIGVAMFAGLLLSRLTDRLHLPDVTCYLVTGLLIGPLCIGRLGLTGIGFTSFELVESLGLVCDVALGFIAFSIGSEFRITALRKIGKQAAVIAVFQALAATVLVDIALLVLHLWLGDKLPISSCLLLGAIATATAPAATLMVVNQYKARGTLTDILLPVVALDDAVGLIVFAVSAGVARAIDSGSISVVSVLVNPILEIVLSLGLGSLLGWVFSLIEKYFNSNSKRLCLAVAFVMLCVGLSKIHVALPYGIEIGFSSLLVCMMCATVFCNLCSFSEEIMMKTDRWTAPIYVLFFVMSGAELDLRMFADWAVVGIGVVYILVRSIGKIFGASASARIMRCDESICKYLGVTLLPQAGVALGMSVTVAAQFGEPGVLVRNIVLFAVLIYELVGPMLTKLALTAAGNISPKPTTDVRR